MREFTIHVPGSSANLGSGFDSLAVALDCWLHVTVRLRNDGLVRDAGAPELLGGQNLVIDAMQVAARRFTLELPGCDVEVVSDIPVARGLGSSAAAIVAGIVAAGVAAGRRISDAEIVNVGGELEGHADNISASVLGGVTVSVRTPTGWIADVISPDVSWTPVAFIPTSHSFTSGARAILPRDVPMPDVVFNVGRAGLLVHAFHTRQAGLLRDAMDDRLHQPYRAAIFPHLLPCISAALEAGAAGACLSGAGPAVLALAEPHNSEEVADALLRAAAGTGVDGESCCMLVPSRGVRIDDR